MKFSKIYAICMNKFDSRFIVQETLDQLRYTTLNKIKVMSWGAHKFKNLDDRGLLFEVNARRHKGFILITLHYTDTYNVYLISRTGKIKKEMNGVYCDELTERIDDAIEKVDAYRY